MHRPLKTKTQIKTSQEITTNQKTTQHQLWKLLKWDIDGRERWLPQTRNPRILLHSLCKGNEKCSFWSDAFPHETSSFVPEAYGALAITEAIVKNTNRKNRMKQMNYTDIIDNEAMLLTILSMFQNNGYLNPEIPCFDIFAKIMKNSNILVFQGQWNGYTVTRVRK